MSPCHPFVKIKLSLIQTHKIAMVSAKKMKAFAKASESLLELVEQICSKSKLNIVNQKVALANTLN